MENNIISDYVKCLDCGQPIILSDDFLMGNIECPKCHLIFWVHAIEKGDE